MWNFLPARRSANKHSKRERGKRRKRRKGGGGEKKGRKRKNVRRIEAEGPRRLQ